MNVANDDQVRAWAKDLAAERALSDDLAGALTAALDLLDADGDIAVPNAIRNPLTRYLWETRQR